MLISIDKYQFVYDIIYNEENKSNGKQKRTSRASDGSKNYLSFGVVVR
jgi:hypothetical protein